jgi:hypothetical protein
MLPNNGCRLCHSISSTPPPIWKEGGGQCVRAAGWNSFRRKSPRQSEGPEGEGGPKTQVRGFSDADHHRSGARLNTKTGRLGRETMPDRAHGRGAAMHSCHLDGEVIVTDERGAPD